MDAPVTRETGDRITVTIRAAKGAYAGMPEERAWAADTT